MALRPYFFGGAGCSNQFLVLASASAGEALVDLPKMTAVFGPTAPISYVLSGAFPAHDLMHIDLGAKPEKKCFEAEDGAIHIHAHRICTG